MVKWSDLLLGVGAIARVVGSIPRPSCENSSDQELDLGMTNPWQPCVFPVCKNTGYFQSQFDDLTVTSDVSHVCQLPGINEDGVSWFWLALGGQF